MYRRPGEGQPATRDDPNRWRIMYAMHDDAPQPRHSKRLRQMLEIVVAEFISGGPLFVRRWTPRYQWAGWLVARVPIKPPEK